MGANQTEYENSFRNNSASDLKNNVDESKFGNAYQKHMGKMMLPGALAPMAGMMGSSALNAKSEALSGAGDMVGSQDFGNYADMALGAGSALGAVAAPLMFRSGTKQTASNASDMNDRSKALSKGQRMTGSQKADTALNAGTAVQKAGMAGVGTAYGANAANIAMGGSGLVSGQQTMAMMKGASAFTPGGAAVNSALTSQGQNPFAAFTTDAAGKAGAVDYGSIGMGGGDMAGMAVMMAAMMGGQKLTKGIKGMANAGGKDKYKYRSASLNTPAPDRDLNKYNILGSSFGAQVSLLMMTDKLSPYENLALTALSAIAKNTGAGPALFQFLTGKEDMGARNLKLSHNKMAGMMGQEDEFSSLSGHTKAGKKGSIAELVEQYSHVMDSIDRTILGVSKGIQGGATALNPLNILFGGLFGPSAEKQISGLFGLDEESVRDNAIERTAKNLNLPVGMVAIAETRADKILKMAGDDPDSKKIAALQLIAEINRNQLLLMLDEKKKDEGGFIGKTQEQFEIMDNSSGVEGALKKFRGLVGNVPGLGLIASVLALQEAREKNREDTARRLADDLDFQQGRSDDSMNHEALANSFLGTEFPLLFLETMDLDTERNILLTEIRDMVEQQSIGNDPSAMKARRGMYPREKKNNTWNMVTGSIMSNQESDAANAEDFEKNQSEIMEFFKDAMKKHPKESKEIKRKRDLEIDALKRKHGDKELSLQEGKDKENKEKREKLLTTVLLKLQKSISNPQKINIKNSSTGATAPNTNFLQRFMGGGLKGKLWSAGRATMGALLAVFQMAVQHGKKVLIGGAALAYLGYRISKTEFGRELAGKVAGAYKFMKKQADQLGITGANVVTVASTVVIASIFRDLYMAIPAKNKKMRAAVGIMALAAMGATAFGTIGVFKRLKTGSMIDVLYSLPVIGNLAKSLGMNEDLMPQSENEKTISTIMMILEGMGLMLLNVKNPWVKGVGAILLFGAFLQKGGGNKIRMAIAAGQDAFGKMIKDLLGDGMIGDKVFKMINGKLNLTGNVEQAKKNIVMENVADYNSDIKEMRAKAMKGKDRYSKDYLKDNIENLKLEKKLLRLHKSYDEKDGKSADGKIEDRYRKEYDRELLTILKKTNEATTEAAQNALKDGETISDGTSQMIAELRNMARSFDNKVEFKVISSTRKGKVQYEFD